MTIEKELPGRGHTVTNWLDEGACQNRNEIIQRVMEEYRNLWTKIARDIIGSHRCRSIDAEDVLLESLKVLSDRLALPDRAFLDRKHIKCWMNRVVQNKALATRRKNARIEGPSFLARTKEEGKSDDILAAFLEAVGANVEVDPTADVEAMERELQEQIDNFNAVVEATLKTYSEEEQRLLNAWLNDGRSFDWLVENFFGKRRYQVRKVVDAFREDLDADGQLQELQTEVAIGEMRRPGVGKRLKFGISCRLIFPHWGIEKGSHGSSSHSQ